MTASENLRPARPPRTRLAGAAAPVTAWLRAAVADCRYAQRRMLELSTATDRYLPRPQDPPDTYAEFLMRTSGHLRREPSARDRVRQAQQR